MQIEHVDADGVQAVGIFEISILRKLEYSKMNIYYFKSISLYFQIKVKSTFNTKFIIHL